MQYRCLWAMLQQRATASPHPAAWLAITSMMNDEELAGGKYRNSVGGFAAASSKGKVYSSGKSSSKARGMRERSAIFITLAAPNRHEGEPP